MEVFIAFLIAYVVSAAIGTFLLVGWWSLFTLGVVLSIQSSDQEPRWVRILGWYCTPVGYLIASPIFAKKGIRRLLARRQH
jgi:hypothetical protein